MKKFWILGLLSLSSCGVTGTTGPLDGTWIITSATCGGVAANAAYVAAYITAPATNSFIFSNSTARITSIDAVSCTQTLPLLLSYPSSSTFKASGTGLYSCVSAACPGSLITTALCGTSASSFSQTFSYSRSGSTLTIQGTGTLPDSYCTASGVGMSAPGVWTLTKQ